jgi:hypothetical protein
MNFKLVNEIKYEAVGKGFLVSWIGLTISSTIFFLFLGCALIFFGMPWDHVVPYFQTKPLAVLVPFLCFSFASFLLGGYVTGRIAKQQIILHGIVLGTMTYFYFVWFQASKHYPLWFIIPANLFLIPIGGFGASLAQAQNDAGSRIAKGDGLKICGLAFLLGGIPVHLIGLWVSYSPRFFTISVFPMLKYMNHIGWTCSIFLLVGLVCWVNRIMHILRFGLDKYKLPALPNASSSLTVGEIFSVWLTLGLVIAPFMWFGTGLFIFEDLKTSIGKAGYPTQYSYSAPTIPDNQNSVFWIRKALACPSLYDFDDKNPDGKQNVDLESRFINRAYSGKFDTSEIKETQALLNHNAKPIQLIRRAAECSASNWGKEIPIFLDNGGCYTPNRHAGRVLSLARLLACQALLSARKGQTEESLNLIRDGLRLAKVYESTDYLIDEIFAVAINRLCLSVAPYALEKSSAQMVKDKWGDLLKPGEIPERVKKALAVELFSFPIHRIERIPDFNGHFQGLDGYYFPFLPLDLDSQLRYGKEILDSCHQPYIQTAPLIDQAEKRFQNKSWWFSNLATPMFGQMYGKSLVNTAQFRMALLALASRDYMDRNGRWPEGPKDLSGSNLDPSIFIDPFSGNSMIFKRQGEHLLIYSIGFDLKDEQGQETKDEEKSKTGNLDWLL